MTDRDIERHDEECDCELNMDDGFASERTLQAHITKSIAEYGRVSIGMTDAMVMEALAVLWRGFVESGKAQTND